MRRIKWAKKCSECGKGIRHWNKSGLCSWDYIKMNKEKLKEYQKKYREENKEKLKE